MEVLLNHLNPETGFPTLRETTMFSNRANLLVTTFSLAIALAPLSVRAQTQTPTPTATPSEVLGRPSSIPLVYDNQIEESLRREEAQAVPQRTPLYLKVKITHGTEMSVRFSLKSTDSDGTKHAVQIGSVAPFPRVKPTDPPSQPVLYTLPVPDSASDEVLALLEGCGVPTAEGVPVRKIGERDTERSRSRFRVLEATLSR